MKMISSDVCADITVELFNGYVEPLGVSYMSGQVPSVVLRVHRSGTKEKDWLPHIQFKDTLAISVFHCDVYLDDIFRFCRMCRLWLVTEGVFRVAVLYSMVYSLFQAQATNELVSPGTDLSSSMTRAGKQTYRFMIRCFTFRDPEERTVLEIIKYHMMIFTNHPWGDGNPREEYRDCRELYQKYMLRLHPQAYRTARYRKASGYLVDEDGYIILERKTEGYQTSTQDEDRRNIALLTAVEPKEEKPKKAYTIEAEEVHKLKEKRIEGRDGYIQLNSK